MGLWEGHAQIDSYTFHYGMKTKVKMHKLRVGGNLGNAKKRCFFLEGFLAQCTCDNLEIYVRRISTFLQDAGS